MGFIRDLFYGDWFDRLMAGLLLLCGVAVITLLVSLPWIYAAEKRETKRLLAAGCEITSTRQQIYFVPMSTGKTTTIVPQIHYIDTWECPDGSRFER
jgi:hypothetical protein